MKYRYSNKYRPPGYATLPKGWELVERPSHPSAGYERRIDLPRSSRPFGVVEFDRPLSPAEVEAYELDEVK